MPNKDPCNQVVVIENRIKHWMHRMEMNQTEFAEFLGRRIQLVNKWIQQKSQPELETVIDIYIKLKPIFPEMHMEDLFIITIPNPED